MSSIKQVRLGLEIIEKYSPNDTLQFDHDIIYAGVDTKMTDEDQMRLDELGWSFDEKYKCWTHF